MHAHLQKLGLRGVMREDNTGMDLFRGDKFVEKISMFDLLTLTTADKVEQYLKEKCAHSGCSARRIEASNYCKQHQ